MSASPDDDVAAAVVAHWNGDDALVAAVPGGLKQGPTDRSASVYALIEVKQGVPANQYMAGPAGGRPYIDYRQVTLSIRGLKADVTAALSLARRRFEDRYLPTLAGFQASYPLTDSGSLAQDPAAKAGEDIWVGTVRLQVITNRII